MFAFLAEAGFGTLRFHSGVGADTSGGTLCEKGGAGCHFHCISQSLAVGTGIFSKWQVLLISPQFILYNRYKERQTQYHVQIFETQGYQSRQARLDLYMVQVRTLTNLV